MDASTRLSHYKRLLADGQALTVGQKADMDSIIKERGIASSFAMPAGGAKQTEAKLRLA